MRINEVYRIVENLPSNFLTEAVKNTHLTHIEDLIIDGGEKGARDALNILYSLQQMLQGHSEVSIDITTKFDGAPAIFSGINPENGEFFVGTKSVWAKKQPKILYNYDDVDQFYEGELAHKLKMCLKHLPKLGINEVLQGDLMFTSESLEFKKVEGQPSIVFQPNTIAYVVPLASGLAKEIRRAKLGIVFHTTYTGGPTLHDMSASFGADVSHLYNHPDVWFRDASYEDVSGEATLDGTEQNYVNEQLQYANELLQDIDKESWRALLGTGEFVTLFNRFINHTIREKANIPDSAQDIVHDFLAFYKATKETEMQKLKTQKGRDKKQQRLDRGLEFFKYHIDQLTDIVELYKVIMDLKTFFVRKLEQIETLGTFNRQGNNFQATTPEGFVAVDHLSGNAIKLVDRLQFSLQNFKQWSE